MNKALKHYCEHLYQGHQGHQGHGTLVWLSCVFFVLFCPQRCSSEAEPGFLLISGSLNTLAFSLLTAGLSDVVHSLLFGAFLSLTRPLS